MLEEATELFLQALMRETLISKFRQRIQKLKKAKNNDCKDPSDDAAQ